MNGVEQELEGFAEGIDHDINDERSEVGQVENNLDGLEEDNNDNDTNEERSQVGQVTEG